MRRVRDDDLLLFSSSRSSSRWIWVGVCVLGSAENKIRNGKEERQRREERERNAGMKTGNSNEEQENNERKTKEFIMWFEYKGNRNGFWVFKTFNDIYLYKTKLLMDIIKK